jgi:hypothetical protein
VNSSLRQLLQIDKAASAGSAILLTAAEHGKIHLSNNDFDLELFKQRYFTHSGVGMTPSRGKSHLVFARMRPSTLLGYLFACGPAQLPMPFETLDANNSDSYLELLTTYVDSATTEFKATEGFCYKENISRSLY